MCHLAECGLDSFLSRGSTAFQPDVQHRADGNGAAVLFLIVETEPAIAVCFRVLIWLSLSSSASLAVTRRLFHDCLHAVEGEGIGQVYFDLLLLEK